LKSDLVIVFLSLLFVAEEFVGLLDLLELVLLLCLQSRVLDLVGMAFEDKLSVGRSDLGELGIRGNTQGLVRIRRKCRHD
jgi:hypothetical protein